MAPRQLAEQIASGSAGTIVDVRSRAEFTNGHVPGALHIPFWQIRRKVAAISSSHDDRLVVYCGHGPRALMAGATLRRLGFTRIVYLKGHWSAWRRARLPVERG
jgi:rhodanese-related sulfurtransferase